VHTRFVVTVSENKKHILQDGDVELTEKDVGCLSVSLGHVIHELEAHCETSILNLPVIMLASPHA
jgi:hypothetical protein